MTPDRPSVVVPRPHEEPPRSRPLLAGHGFAARLIEIALVAIPSAFALAGLLARLAGLARSPPAGPLP